MPTMHGTMSTMCFLLMCRTGLICIAIGKGHWQHTCTCTCMSKLHNDANARHVWCVCSMKVLLSMLWYSHRPWWLLLHQIDQLHPKECKEMHTTVSMQMVHDCILLCFAVLEPIPKFANVHFFSVSLGARFLLYSCDRRWSSSPVGLLFWVMWG